MKCRFQKGDRVTINDNINKTLNGERGSYVASRVKNYQQLKVQRIGRYVPELGRRIWLEKIGDGTFFVYEKDLDYDGKFYNTVKNNYTV